MIRLLYTVGIFHYLYFIRHVYLEFPAPPASITGINFALC